MADAVIDVLGVEELPLVVDLYNQIFRPSRAAESFQRPYLGRHNVLQMIARIKDRPVGFFLGFELKPETFFGWFYGVLPDFRRMGIGSQLIEAAHSWAAHNDYEWMRIECQNQHRPVLHIAISQGYDIIGTRWDADRGDNLVIFEKRLTES
jgi:GNAT superfamily N-acetyltransferase